MIQPHFSRRRDLSDGKTYQSLVYHEFNGTLSSSYRSQFYESKRAVMEDCINPYGSRGFRAPGPCNSYKIVRLDSPSVEWHSANVESPPAFETYGETVSRNHFDLEQIVSSLPSVPVSIVQDNRIAASMKSITQVPTDVSVINFALEAAEFKSTFEHYSKAVTKGGLRLKEVPGWANSTLLDYSFNLSPFVGDIDKMIRLYDRVAGRIDFLLKTRGELVRQNFFNPNLWSNNPHVGTVMVHNDHTPPFGETDAWPYSTYLGADYYSHPTKYGYTSLEIDEFAATFSASWYLVQELEGLEDKYAQLRGLIAGAGINNPLKIVWNAIPFSFIADWMFPFGKLLDSFAVQPFRGRWEIYDFVNSVKETWHLTQKQVYEGQSAADTIVSNRILVERYNRKVGATISLSDVDLTDFDDRQQLLLGSLIAGNTLFRNGKKTPKKKL